MIEYRKILLATQPLPLQARRVSTYARVDNAFDERYRTVANYGTDGRAVYGGVRVKLD